ncbi:MAG: protein kinase [Thermoleophilia bacterium]|nr:protein kinase [Thermoleophilia bacterium]
MIVGARGFEAGDVLGDFRVIRKLGEGGMGVVYLAEDERLKRRVALKVITPHLARDEEFRRRFIAEARSAAAIDHPNVVTIYSSGTIDGRLYIAMRYVDGTDLRAALAGAGKLEVAVAVAILGEVAAALDAAHAAGMVHRDVKPGNILLDGAAGQGRAFLTDFGLTKGSGDAGTQLTGTGQWVGTIDYVAPEQIQGGTIDARTDVYALGCVLFECLTGTVPFAGNDMQKMWGHVNEPFPPFDTVDVDQAAELGAVLERATTKDPRGRFPSAGDLARAASAAAVGGRVEDAERSVAVGPAAEGLTEPAADRLDPRTRTGRAPASFRDLATTRMSKPPDAPRRASAEHSPKSSRTPLIAAAAAILGAGLIAGAIVIAGSDSGPTKATTVVREAASASSTDAGTEEAESGGTEDLELGATEDWSGGSAYSAMLGAFSSEAGAREWQDRALERGLEAGVLYSSNFSSLSPGYWVVFSGSFGTPEEADLRAREARALRFPESYAKYVSP